MPAPTLEIATMLVLSTAYITEHTCNVYLPRRTVAYDKAGAGWFVSTHLDETDSDPDDLAMVLAFARGGGHEWVMFDQDGPQDVDGLPLHLASWDAPSPNPLSQPSRTGCGCNLSEECACGARLG